MKTLKSVLALVVFCMISICANAQMAQFKALYLYNFAKNIGWPEADNGSDLVITVIGDNELSSELEKLAKSRMVGSRKVIVKQAATIGNLDNSQIVYLSDSKSSQIVSLVAHEQGKKSLVVGGKAGLCSQGASISFIPVDGKLKYEISNSNIKKSGLSVAAKILQLGIEVN